MPPIPCAHCGVNFMRRTPYPNASMLCNCCELKEEIRNPKAPQMEKVSILIRCTLQEQIEIEEFCINQGLDFAEYFMHLHKEYKKKVIDESLSIGVEEAEEKQEKKTKGAKK